MYIFIDNSVDDLVSFFYFIDKEWERQDFAPEHFLAEDLVVLLNAVRKKNQDIQGIAVKVGSGRFTGTRVAVTFANTLAYVLKIPVLAVTENNMDEVLRDLQKTKAGTYISAKYSSEPNIGKKTKQN